MYVDHLCRDLSYNNLSGSLPKISARTFKCATLFDPVMFSFPKMLVFINFQKLSSSVTCRIVGNPLICGPKGGNNCSAVIPEPLSFPPDALKGVFHINFSVVC